MSALSAATAFTLKAEGKYWDDPIGGPTMYGVTQTTYDAYRKKEGLHLQSVRLIEMDEVLAIMDSEYWTPGHCDEMPLKLAVAHFDWCYNHGVSGAIHSLQTCLGVASDGVFGSGTLAALKTAILDNPGAFLTKYLDARRQWYRDDAATKPEAAADLEGWLNRVDELQNYLEGLS